jgi:uncharacterized protein (TIGR02594 family)
MIRKIGARLRSSRKLKRFRGDEGGSTALAAAVGSAVLAVIVGAPILLEPTGAALPTPAIIAAPDPGAAGGRLIATPGFSGIGRAAVNEAQPGPDATAEPGATALRVALSFIGKSEAEHAGTIGAFIIEMTGNVLDVRETPWCAAFVNAVLQASGIEGTGSLSARSFLNLGTETKTPKPGDLAVFWRGDPNGRAGHVGFYAWEIERSGEIYICVIGGNQHDSVSRQLYPKSQLIGYRRLPSAGAGQGT